MAGVIMAFFRQQDSPIVGTPSSALGRILLGAALALAVAAFPGMAFGQELPSPEDARRPADGTSPPRVSSISPDKAALLGVIPGLGQIALGNTGSGVAQASVFWGSLLAGSRVAGGADYIKSEDRQVKYSLEDVLVGRALQQQGLLYSADPAYGLAPEFRFTETSLQRDQRLLQHGRVGEMNALVEYGEYSRMNTRTAMADSYGLLAQSTLFYSVYSGYRDAGAGRAGETLQDLLAAPFQSQYVLDPHVLVPLVVLAAMSAQNTRDMTGSPVTLVNDRFMTDGTREFLTVYQSMNAGVAEEAFFRGYLNDMASRRFGPWGGGFISGTIFGLAHTANGVPVSAVLPQTIMGYYFAYLQNLNDGDIRPGIALHFWWDVIVFALQARTFKADSRVGLTPREANYMPLTYTVRF